jgi:hypothetical protein
MPKRTATAIRHRNLDAAKRRDSTLTSYRFPSKWISMVEPIDAAVGCERGGVANPQIPGSVITRPAIRATSCISRKCVRRSIRSQIRSRTADSSDAFFDRPPAA